MFKRASTERKMRAARLPRQCGKPENSLGLLRIGVVIVDASTYLKIQSLGTTKSAVAGAGARGNTGGVLLLYSHYKWLNSTRVR